VLWANSGTNYERLTDAERSEQDHLAALEATWNDNVGQPLHMTGFARRIGRMYEAACTHETDGWSFSYLADTPEAAFSGLTQIATGREPDANTGRSPWKRYAHS